MATLTAIAWGAVAFLAARALLGRALASRLRVLQGLAAARAAPAARDATEPLSRPFSERVLRPALGAIGGALGRLGPRRLLADTAAALQQAGVRGRPSDWLGAKALAALGLAGYTALLLHGRAAAPALALAALALGWHLPGLYLRSRARRRAAALRDALPDAMDLLTVCVEAGLGFDQALQRVVQRFPGPLGEEFGRVLRDQRLGTPRRQALLGMLDRVDLPELQAFVHAILQAEELGVRVGTALRVQAEELRERRRQRAEETALQAPVKMAFPMILLILPALLLVVLGPAVIQAVRVFGAAQP